MTGSSESDWQQCKVTGSKKNGQIQEFTLAAFDWSQNLLTKFQNSVMSSQNLVMSSQNSVMSSQNSEILSMTPVTKTQDSAED